MTALLESFTGQFVQVSGDPEHNSIVQAILMLLGSRISDVYPVAGQPVLERSILNFGVEDLHRLRNTRQVGSYCEDLALRIQGFDHRLETVIVRAETGDESFGDTLKLMITVRLVGQQESIGFCHGYPADGRELQYTGDRW